MRPTINGTGVVGDTVRIYSNTYLVGTGSVGPNGEWSIKLFTNLEMGTVVLQATQYASGQSQSALSASWTITVYAATISTPVAPTITDGGNVIPSGGSMPDGHPSISGTGTAGDTIKVYDGANVIGSTLVGPDGHWSFTPTTDLSKGSAHPISVIESNAAGATSAQSPATSVTVATPVAAVPVITSVEDAVGVITGAVPNNGFTDDMRPTISGTGVAGDTLYLFKNGNGIGDTVVGPNGLWSIKLTSDLGLGTVTLTATQFANGQAQSAASASWTITVLPATISTPAAPTITDNGNVIPSGGSMPDGHPTISGSGTAKDIITVYDGANVIGSTTVDSNGHWSFTPTTDLSKGSAHPISVIESNATTGATSAQSPATTVTYVSGSVPSAPSITGVTDVTGPYAGNVPSGGTSSDTNPTINGTGHSGDTISVYDGSTLLGTTTVGIDGTWHFKPAAAFSTGSTHSFTATETNAVGTGASSTPYSVYVDTTTGSGIVITGIYQNGVLIPKGGLVTGDMTVTIWFDPKYIQSNGNDLQLYYGNGSWNLLINQSTITWTSSNTASIPLSQATFKNGLAINGQTVTSGLGRLDASVWYHNGPQLANTTGGTWYTFIESAVLQSTQNLSVTHDDTTTASSIDAVAATSSSSTQPEHHTVVGEHDTFVGKPVNGNETVDLNVDPTAYFKQETAHIEGAKGVAIDTLHLTGDHQVLDLTSLTGQTAAAKISGIEVIDLGGHTNTLKLSLTDVLNLGETDLFVKDGKQQMMVNGKEGDEVDLSNSHIAGLAEGEWQAHGTAQVGGVTYNVYEHSGVHTELLVQQGVQIVVH